ncbi:MAG TPA: LPS export ABC transporter periplasmic protein LptC [Alphaproteobacteria bacterium]|nr:LPS export ABC transporter periplasmic protein LptC [Alphaproteobacteria bacterium]
MNAQKTDLFSPAARVFSPQRLLRHTRFVSGMKLVLPSLAAGIVLVLMIWPSSVHPPAPPRKTTALDSTMQAPVYSSRDEKGQPFRVQADQAKQNPTAPGLTDLANPTGAIELQGGGNVQGQAQGAQYDQKEGKLSINGNLTLRHSSGATFQTQKAVVDMNERSASGNAPVKVTGGFGEVNANGFQLLNEGKTVIFTGHPTAHLKLGAGGDANPASAMQGLLPSSAPGDKPAPPPSIPGR